MLWVRMGYFCNLGESAVIDIEVKGQSRVCKHEDAYVDWEASGSISQQPQQQW